VPAGLSRAARAPAPRRPCGPLQPGSSLRRRPGARMAAGMLAAGLAIGSVAGGAVGAVLVSHRNTGTPPSAVATVAPGVGAPAASPGSFAAIYQQAKNGVVTINASTSSAGPRSFSQAEGSGIVVDTQGDILTNAHVVSGASQIRVTCSDGRTAPGHGKAVAQRADLAVVTVSV